MPSVYNTLHLAVATSGAHKFRWVTLLPKRRRNGQKYSTLILQQNKKGLPPSNAYGNQMIHAGEAATKALKLYEGGFSLKLKPGGQKSSVTAPFLTIRAETLQLVVKGSQSLERPALTWYIFSFVPHVRMTDPGEFMSTTAHR